MLKLLIFLVHQFMMCEMCEKGECFVQLSCSIKQLATVNDKSLANLQSDEFGSIKFGKFIQNVSKCKARLGFG